jgi:hypothetical protein
VTEQITLVARPRDGNRILRVCCGASTTFVVAAVVIGASNIVSPFERGWWLATYLFLVGGASQLLLVGGQLVVIGRRGTSRPPRALAWTQLALWNIGTAAVAVTDMVRALVGVAIGSGILVTALVLFLAGLRRVEPPRTATLERSYLMLLIFLAGCVVVGTFLAAAAPRQQ